MSDNPDEEQKDPVLVKQAERPKDAIPSLASVKMQTTTRDGNVEIRGEVRIGFDEFEGDDNLSFEVRLKKAKLKLLLQGYQISMGTRFGDEPYQPKVLTEIEKRSSETSATVSGGLSANASSKDGAEGKMQVGAKAKRELRLEKSYEITNVISEREVLSNADESWRIIPIGGQKCIRDGFMFNERLCDVFQLTGANSRSISLALTARQKDLSFDNVHSAKWFKNPTDEALAKIYIAKMMSGLGSEYRGELELSLAEMPEEK